MEYMTMTEARKYLGVSKTKIRHLVKANDILVHQDPLDHRKRLVKREDIEKLKQPKPL